MRPLVKVAWSVSLLAMLMAGSGGASESAVTGGEESRAAIVVLERVSLLDPVNGRGGPATVVIGGSSIAAVGPAAAVEAPAGARRIDASGRFLLPGLWDLHTHLAMVGDWAPPLLVTQGVTGVRDLGAKLEEIEALRARIEGGELLGPRIVRAGPTLNGARNGAHHRVIDSAEAARVAVEELAAAGVDLLKVHNATGREAYFALLEAAEAAGLQVVGHVPTSVEPLEACRAGHASVEHIATIFEGTYLSGFDGELEAFQSMPVWLEEEAPKIVSCFAEHQTLFVPTLRTYEIRALRAEEYDNEDPRRRYMGADDYRSWRESAVPSELDRRPEVRDLRMSLVKVGQELVRLLRDAGAPIGAGTDLARGLLPGFDLHREIHLLAGAGLTPREALRAATRGPGAAAGGHPLQGQLVAGAPADLVLLGADGFEDLAALDAIEGVVRGGRYLDRAELDAILAGLERSESGD